MIHVLFMKVTTMSKQHLIWDLPLRIFHWGMIIIIGCLWVTSDQDLGLIELHIKFGYTALGFLIFRIIWGIVGTKHSQFKNFIPSFTTLKQYIIDSRLGKIKHYVGHNPIGSLMVILMLLLMLGQATSGLFISDDVFSAGPYNGVFSEQVEKIFKTIHTNAFDLLMVAALFHIIAVIYYEKVKKQALIKAMINGKKQGEHIANGETISHSKLILAGVIILGVVIFVYWLVVLNAPIIQEYYY
jgi:cytochrome b